VLFLDVVFNSFCLQLSERNEIFIAVNFFFSVIIIGKIWGCLIFVLVWRSDFGCELSVSKEYPNQWSIIISPMKFISFWFRSIILKVKTISLSETPANIYQITQCHIPEDRIFQNLLLPGPNARNLLYYRKVLLFMILLWCYPAFWWRDMKLNLILSALISRVTTLLASNGLSVFVMKFMLSHNK
jgi:hypothetical protein